MAVATSGGMGRRALWLLLVLAVVAGGVWLYRQRAAAARNKAPTDLTAPVVEGPLMISVTESGTIKPRETTVITSQLEGTSTILYLIPEGRRVKEGDLLVELDASRLIDQRVDQEISVRNAEASFIRSRENLEVVRNQAKADLEKADLTLRFAHEDLKNYKEGEYPNKLRAMQVRIAIAEEKVLRSAETLKWSQQLFDEKYLSATELKADALAAKQTALDLELAQGDLRLFEEHTYKREIDQLTSDVTQAEMALERVRRKTAADVVQAEADLAARDAEFTRQKGKLQKIGEQIGKARITAPTSGSVIYATSAQFSWRGNVDPLAEGQQVRERQELIHLPLADTFMAVVKIHESSLKKIETGMPVQLTVDAVPGRQFAGTVSRIAPLPDQQSAFMNPDLKVFSTEIMIEGGGEILRTGMTCAAEIVVARYERAISVPVQSVVRLSGQPTAYVLEGGKVMPRRIEIGMDNNRLVHVLSGLQEGDRVLLTPPLSNSATAEPLAPAAAPASAAPASAAPVGPSASAAPPAALVAAPAAVKAEAPPAGDAAPNAERAPGRREGAPSPEEMQRMRQRFEAMSPEEREAARRQWQGRRQRPAGGAGAAPAGGAGGAPAERGRQP